MIKRLFLKHQKSPVRMFLAKNNHIFSLIILLLFRFAQNFIDIRERESAEKPGTLDHGRKLMNLHNNEAGRRVSVLSLSLSCTHTHNTSKNKIIKILNH